jgi:hypothetical protein
MLIENKKKMKKSFKFGNHYRRLIIKFCPHNIPGYRILELKDSCWIGIRNLSCVYIVY